ncbi:hypothetical protein pVa21_029 [Vibrio phage pVa-21]|nr:hypothetical protein pVa21_029 [Vibrio phage pVa-21]
MAYVTDMTKRPVEMLLGLINADNNLGLVEADVEILAPQTQAADVDGRNTNVQIDLEVLPSEVQDDFVTFEYERIDLATLFGAIAPEFREVDVPLNENGVPAVAADFYAEILRKFGVAMNETDFSYALKSAGVITITAAAGNLAYIGSFDIAVQSSLETRVATTVLNGFTAPAAA